MFNRCPLQYYFSYIENIKRPLRKGGRLILGRSIHSAFAHNFSYKIGSHEDMPSKKVVEIYAAQFDKNVNEEKQRGIEWEENQSSIKDEGVSLTRLYHSTICPTIIPMMVEKEFLFSLGEGFPNMKGILDLVDIKDVLSDMKVSKMQPNLDMLKWDIQLRTYVIAFKIITGRFPSKAEYHYLRRLKNAIVEKLEMPLPTKAELEWFLQYTTRIIQAISSGIFYPTPNQMNCSWCGYYKDCTQYKKW
jgi:hypothetical protein